MRSGAKLQVEESPPLDPCMWSGCKDAVANPNAFNILLPTQIQHLHFTAPLPSIRCHHTVPLDPTGMPGGRPLGCERMPQCEPAAGWWYGCHPRAQAACRRSAAPSIVPNLQFRSTRQCSLALEACLVVRPWLATQRATVQLLWADAASLLRCTTPWLLACGARQPAAGLQPAAQLACSVCVGLYSTQPWTRPTHAACAARTPNACARGFACPHTICRVPRDAAQLPAARPHACTASCRSYQ